MKKVSIKRVKKNKKVIGPKEKLLTGLGVGASLMGGMGAGVSKSPAQKPIVATNKQAKDSVGGKIKSALTSIFGVQEAKANLAQTIFGSGGSWDGGGFIGGSDGGGGGGGGGWGGNDIPGFMGADQSGSSMGGRFSSIENSQRSLDYWNNVADQAQARSDATIQAQDAANATTPQLAGDSEEDREANNQNTTEVASDVVNNLLDTSPYTSPSLPENPDPGAASVNSNIDFNFNNNPYTPFTPAQNDYNSNTEYFNNEGIAQNFPTPDPIPANSNSYDVWDNVTGGQNGPYASTLNNNPSPTSNVPETSNYIVPGTEDMYGPGTGIGQNGDVVNQTNNSYDPFSAVDGSGQINPAVVFTPSDGFSKDDSTDSDQTRTFNLGEPGSRLGSGEEFVPTELPGRTSGMSQNTDGTFSPEGSTNRYWVNEETGNYELLGAGNNVSAQVTDQVAYHPFTANEFYDASHGQQYVTTQPGFTPNVGVETGTPEEILARSGQNLNFQTSGEQDLISAAGNNQEGTNGAQSQQSSGEVTGNAQNPYANTFANQQGSLEYQNATPKSSDLQTDTGLANQSVSTENSFKPSERSAEQIGTPLITEEFQQKPLSPEEVLANGPNFRESDLSNPIFLPVSRIDGTSVPNVLLGSDSSIYSQDPTTGELSRVGNITDLEKAGWKPGDAFPDLPSSQSLASTAKETGKKVTDAVNKASEKLQAKETALTKKVIGFFHKDDSGNTSTQSTGKATDEMSATADAKTADGTPLWKLDNGVYTDFDGNLYTQTPKGRFEEAGITVDQLDPNTLPSNQDRTITGPKGQTLQSYGNGTYTDANGNIYSLNENGKPVSTGISTDVQGQNFYSAAAGLTLDETTVKGRIDNALSKPGRLGMAAITIANPLAGIALQGYSTLNAGQQKSFNQWLARPEDGTLNYTYRDPATGQDVTVRTTKSDLRAAIDFVNSFGMNVVKP